VRSVHQRVGAVVIGRNEGERLVRCLDSLVGNVRRVVYVDSGSTDGSLERARRLGADVVELDMSVPFTAARARNAGYRRLLECEADIELIQFVDGDCEVVPRWLDFASQRLGARPDVAVVCGRRRELHPESSVYNVLCDIEWDTPVGEAAACGGDAMMRANAVVEVGGYDPTLIAGEEPELCLRMRRRGWKVERLDAEMTRHDASIHAFEQWWKRARRSGFAYAAGSAKHGRGPERHWVKETRRIVFWGGVLPAVALGGIVPSLGLSMSLLAAYPVSFLRTFRHARMRGRTTREAATYAAFTQVGRLPEIQGVLEYHRDTWLGRSSRIIEYKTAQ